MNIYWVNTSVIKCLPEVLSRLFLTYATEPGMEPGTRSQCCGCQDRQVDPSRLAGSQAITDETPVREGPCLNKQGE